MNKQIKRTLLIVPLLLIAGERVSALNVTIDYRYDVNGFFDPGTVNGAAARATVNAAAQFFSNLINDTLSAIPQPSGGNVWRQVFTNPATGQSYSVSSASSAASDAMVAHGSQPADEYRDISISSNQFLIYVGGGSLSSAGLGGGGGFGSFGTPTFNDQIAHRGKPTTEYSNWGGSVAFDNDGSTTWQYDFTQPVGPGKVDLYSTALHEIGHTLGLSPDLTQAGASPVWSNLQAGAEFRGPQTLAAWKADDPAAPAAATGVPTVSSTNTHWKDNAVHSKVIGTNQLQEAAMDPVIFTGTRKLFTNVDGKALVDIGWTIPNSMFDAPAPIVADFNGDGTVNGPDLALWRTSFGVNANANADGDSDSDGNDFLIWQRRLGIAATVPAATTVPEPSAVVLAAVAVGCVCRRCRN